MNPIEIWLFWNPFLAPTDCELACKIIVAFSTFLFDFITTLNLCILHNYEGTSESCQILDNDIAINHVKAYEWISYKFVFTQVAITRKLSNHIEIWLLWNPFLAPTDCELDCKIIVASSTFLFNFMSTLNVNVGNTIVWKSKVTFFTCMLSLIMNADCVALFQVSVDKYSS